MSLINKMLQDLDSRGSSPTGNMGANVKLAPQAERHLSAPLMVGAVATVIAVAVGGTILWRNYKAQQGPSLMDRVKGKPVPAVVPAPLAKPATPAAPTVLAAVSAPASQVDATGSLIVPGPVADAKTSRAAAASASAAGAASAGDTAATAAAINAMALKGGASAPKDDHAGAPAAPSASASHAEPAPKGATVPAKASAKAAASAKARARNEANAAKPAKAAAAAPSAGMELTGTQRAEAEYRRGLNALQDGRNTEAIAALGQAVRLDPRHEAARQTVVSLLIEARRTEEAVRHLQLGLTLDPRQPTMAMLLARLQIERGASGIETLMRTLPYATGNGEYHAFLAGAMAREARHQEAIDQYKLALRGTPNNGVWLIGMALSLQSEKRNAEALDAFKLAKGAPNLTPDMTVYVERRINALTR